MDNLTIALAAAGGLVLAGVVAHGAWQARKVGEKRVAEPPRAEPLDPVMDGGPAPASANTDAEPELGSELSAPRLLRRPTLRRVLTPHLDPDGPLVGRQGFGLGWCINMGALARRIGLPV